MQKMINPKPKGYWRDFKNVEGELRQIISELRHFPSESYLRQNGHGGILCGIQKYHEGMGVVAKRIGYESGKRKNGYWKDFENVKIILRELMIEHELINLPTSNQLDILGCSSVSVAIQKYHGGFQKLREKLGYEQIRVKYGLWKNIDYAIDRAREIKEKHGLDSLPRSSVLSKMGYGDLAAAISSNYKGMRNFRKLLGEKQKNLERGTWNSLEFTINYAKSFMQRNNLTILPPQDELSKYKESSLAQAIIRKHGGFTKFRVFLGEEERMDYGSWKDIDYALNKARELIKRERLNELPCSKKIGELGFTSLSNAIQRYHGGFPKFRKLLGEDVSRKDMGYWRDFGVVIKEIERIMTDNNMQRMPSSYSLQKLGYGSLVRAIHVYHGGFLEIRKLLGEKPVRNADGIWKDIDFTIEQARVFLSEHPEYENLPSAERMQKYPKGSMIVSAIYEYHGGIVLFRRLLEERLGLSSEKRDNINSLLEGYVNE